MKRMIENITGNYSSSASVVDGTLILSLPDAMTPVVWRMDLVHAKASALEVRTSEDGLFTLVLKTPRGDVNEVAKFDNRGRAVSALMSVSRAMESAHGRIYPAANDGQPYNPTHLPVPTMPVRARKINRSGKSWVGAVVAVIAIIVLGSILMNLAPQSQFGGLAATNPAAGAASRAPATQTNGVAVSADEFLKNQ